MLDIAVISVLSVFFEVAWFGAFLAYGFLTRKRKDIGLVKASKPTGFILHAVWSLLPIVLITASCFCDNLFGGSDFFFVERVGP
jgi:hypothetical protein